MRPGTTPEAQMRALKDWAVLRMTRGTDTPFAWFQFMKLVEVIDTFLEAGDDAGLREKLPAPKRKSPRAHTLPGNVVSFEALARRRVE